MVYNSLKCLDQEIFFLKVGFNKCNFKNCSTFPYYRDTLIWSNFGIPIKEKTLLSRVEMVSNRHMDGLALLMVQVSKVEVYR